MRTVNNHKQLLIGKNLCEFDYAALAKYDDDSTSATVATPATIADGQIVVTREDGALVGPATIGIQFLDRLYFVQGQGADRPLIKSALVYKPGITTARAKNYNAGNQQEDYIGYNPDTGLGSIDPINGNAYIVRNSLKTNFYQFSDKEIHVIGDYVSDNSATQEKVATGLTKSLIVNSEKYVNIPFTVERVTDGTLSALANPADVVKGSKSVTSVAHGLSVGDYVAFAALSYEAVYVVTSVPTVNTFTIDIAFQGTTGSVAAYSVTGITAWGIHLTGLPQAKFRAGVFRYEKSKWISTLQNGGSTPVTSPYIVANEGSGRYEQIAEDEWFYQLGEGFADSNTIQIPPVEFRKNVELNGTYSTIELEWKDIAGGTDILLNPTVFKQLKVAFNREKFDDCQANTIFKTVDAWLVATPAASGGLQTS